MRHEVVHNKYVVDRLRAIGAVFVEELDEVPDGGTVIFSAHGVSRRGAAGGRAARGCTVFDATCPLVTKVHMEVARYAREAREVFLIGHAGPSGGRGHDRPVRHSLGGGIYLVETVEDVASAAGQQSGRIWRSSPRRRCRWTTRPRSSRRCGARFPALKAPLKEDICYATQNRQDAVKELIGRCDVLVVVGSQSSSNSNRLRELADKAGKPGYLVDGPEDLHREWFDGRGHGRRHRRRLGTGNAGPGGHTPTARVGRGTGRRGRRAAPST